MDKKITYLMTNSANKDQLASSEMDLHCLGKKGISWFSSTRVKTCRITSYINMDVCKGLFAIYSVICEGVLIHSKERAL